MDRNRITDIQKRIAEIDETLCVSRCDLSDPADIRRIKDMIYDVFARLKGDDKGGAAISEPVMKRRKQAVFQTLEQVNTRYADRYPDLSVIDAFIRINASEVSVSFRDLNREYAIELAAAIWILDTLTESGSLEAAYEYLPKSREELNSVYLPNLTDSVHGDDILRSMIYLIRNRNRADDSSAPAAPFPDEEAACGHDPASVPGSDLRARYDAVIALIDAERIEDAEARFIRELWRFTDEIFACADRLNLRLSESRRALRGELAALSLQPGTQKIQGAASLATDAEIVFEQATVSVFGSAATHSEALRSDNEVRKNESDLNAFYSLIQMIPSSDCKALTGEDGGDVYDGIVPPEIRDPYEMCFAFLSLLDKNRDEIWLYPLAFDILAFACRALPWADAGVVDPDNTAEELRVDYEYLAALIEKTPDWDEHQAAQIMYRKRLHSPLCTPDNHLISFAQLAFLSSGLIPPRRAASISYTKAILGDSDLSREQIDLLYEYFSLAYAVSHKESEYTDLEAMSGEDSDDAGSAEEIKQLRSEIKRLKSALHRFERRNKEAESRLSEITAELEEANRELAELRSMIRETDDTDEASQVSVAFPYTAQKRSVIIGGHDSWIKAIKPLLKNVRFIMSSEQPNPGVLLNCEVIWLQTNALGHSSYYKTMDIARRNHIKVCYFSYASAEKCAEQFALEDARQDDPDEAEDIIL